MTSLVTSIYISSQKLISFISFPHIGLSAEVEAKAIKLLTNNYSHNILVIKPG